jgi:sugar/nucleoside kinase (ribokinase family)
MYHVRGILPVKDIGEYIMGIVVIGTVAIDNVVTPFGENLGAPGGSATYFSLSASYFTRVRLVAVIGRDFPRRHIRLFKSKGIDIEGLEQKDGNTFRWSGKYGWDLDNPETIATHLNLLQDFDPVIPRSYENEDILFLANIDPDLQWKVLKQSRAKIIAADTMNFWIERKRDKLLKVLKRLDMLIINEYESRQLTGEPNLLKAGRKIISYGTDKVVIKKGENGVLFISRNGFFACPAHLMENVLDPTGAGDTFAGGFLGYLSRMRRYDDAAIKRAIIYGIIMASFAVEAYDIRSLKRQDRRSIDKRYKAFKRVCSF